MTDIYDNIPQESLHWLDRLSGKTGAALPADAQTAPTGWLPAEVSARLEPGKTYVMTINDEVLAVTAPDHLTRGLEGTAPASHTSGSTLYQAFTAHQLRWLVSTVSSADTPGEGQDPGHGDCSPEPDGPLSFTAVTLTGETASTAADAATDGNGNWVVVGGKHGGTDVPVSISTDSGETWQPGGVPFLIDASDSVTCIGGRFLAARYEQDRHPTISASVDGGQTWTLLPGSPGDKVAALESGGGVVMAWTPDGEHQLYVSVDSGDTWSPSGLDSERYAVGPHAPVWHAGKWYALVEDKDNDYAAVLAVSDDDGDTWQFNALPGYCTQLAAQNGSVMVLQSGVGIKISDDDGATWADCASLPENPETWNLSGISVDGKGRWLVFGNQGYLAYSDDDGASWELVTSPHANAAWSSAVYHCGRWVIVGPNAAAISE